MFSGFTGQERFNPINSFSSGIATNNPITVNTPTTDMSSVSAETPSLIGANKLYAASTPDKELVYLDQRSSFMTHHPTGKEAAAFKIISATDLYKEYTQYPHTPWHYEDLSGAGYPGYVRLTTGINPRQDITGPYEVNQLYNPDVPASGELTFLVDLNTGKILNQRFDDYRSAL